MNCRFINLNVCTRKRIQIAHVTQHNYYLLLLIVVTNPPILLVYSLKLCACVTYARKQGTHGKHSNAASMTFHLISLSLALALKCFAPHLSCNWEHPFPLQTGSYWNFDFKSIDRSINAMRLWDLAIKQKQIKLDKYLLAIIIEVHELLYTLDSSRFIFNCLHFNDLVYTIRTLRVLHSIYFYPKIWFCLHAHLYIRARVNFRVNMEIFDWFYLFRKRSENIYG